MEIPCSETRKNRPLCFDWAGRVRTVKNALGQTTSRTYDWTGNVATATDAAGTTAQYRYDTAGRLLEAKQPFDATRTATVTYAYDQNGNIVTETSDTGVKSYTYDNRGNLHTANMGAGIQAAYGYDSMGNLRTMTMANGAVTAYDYDRFGNLRTLTDALGQVEGYTHDLNGNLLTKTDRNGAVTTYSHDNLGRVTRAEVQTGSGVEYLAQAYTLTGQLKSESDGKLSATYLYDELGRLKKETMGNEVKNYNYNLADLRKDFTLTVGGVQQLSNTYGYDALGRLETVTGSGVTAGYQYDANGNRKTLTYGNGVTATYQYNKANLVTQVANKRGSTVLSQYDYTYYPDGNQQTKTDHTGLATTYTYTAAGALASETARRSGVLQQSYTYAYNNVGNRTALTAAGAESYSTSYDYDKNNRLLTEARTGGGTTATTEYRYDPNGNLYSSARSTLTSTSGAIPALKLVNGLDGVTLYGYDGFNRQTSVKTSGMEASYSYQPNGLRRSKMVGGVKTEFLWDGSQTVAERSGGTVTAKYVRGMNLIASVKGSVNTYYVYNAHGDVVQLANASGTVTKNYSYDAFGVEKDPAAGDANPFRYCGEYWDGETSTYYLRARNYNPATGRFSAEDPIRDGLNWYTYCGGNPVMFFDPFGLALVPAREYAMANGADDVVWNGNYTNADDGDRTWARATIYRNGSSLDITGQLIDGKLMIDDSMLNDFLGCGSYVGGALPQVRNPVGGNCYSYALHLDKWRTLKAPTLMGKEDEVYIYAKCTIADIEEFLGQEARVISGPYAPIGPDEYRIVLRTTLNHNPNNGTNLSSIADPSFDHHFMVQTDQGSWAHKMGGGSTAFLDVGQTPSTIGYWQFGEDGFCYNSDIVYIAVKVRD